MGNTVLDAIAEHIKVVQALRCLSSDIEEVALSAVETYRSGAKVVLFGNGGSSCDAQHIAAEMLGVVEDQSTKRGLLAVSLADNTALITAIGNDLGYADVFSRQVEAIVQEKDLVIGLSTSGNSPNVVKGIATAKNLGAKTVVLIGRRGALAEIAEVAIHVPSNSVPRIQEAHMIIGHIICEMAQRMLSNEYVTRFKS
jgi:D-sedoheptulose 7-phosphate isomerase